MIEYSELQLALLFWNFTMKICYQKDLYNQQKPMISLNRQITKKNKIYQHIHLFIQIENFKTYLFNLDVDSKDHKQQ